MNIWKNSALIAIAVLMAMDYSPAAFAQQRGRRPPPAAKKKEEYVRPSNIQYTSMHHMAGCGLGSLAFKDEEKWTQVGASLLNGTGMQTFAISFGTSNCTYDGVVDARLEREAFVEANYADLTRDIAVGDGEYISALATLYGCHGENKAVFKSAVHEKSAALIDATKDATNEAGRVIGVVDGILSGNKVLRTSCSNS